MGVEVESLFTAALGLQAPWSVQSVQLDTAKHRIDFEVRCKAKRRRLKTVIQELVYRAGRLIRSARQLVLGLGANDRAAGAFVRLHEQLVADG